MLHAPPPDDPAVALQRLERRLQRERQARAEAEAIAESGLRDLYNAKKRLRLLEMVATAANEAVSIDKALGAALDEICDFTGWPLGHVFEIKGRNAARRAVSTGVWRGLERGGLEKFFNLSQTQAFPLGVGLPGRVLQLGAAAWIPDVRVEPNFPRCYAAGEAGLKAAFAFPVWIGTEVVAVVEFFAEDVLEPDPDLLDTMEKVGRQLGRAIERDRAARRVAARNRKLKLLVAEAQGQRAAAETASRAKSAFLAVTSHEVRTPLNAVLGLAEALRREDLTARQTDLVEGVLDSGAMLLRLLNAVLDLSKIEAGKMTAEPKAFDLAAVLKAVVRIWSPKAEEMGLRLELDLSRAPSPCGLLADPGKVEQTLVNLISNALKFSPRGGTVRVAAIVEDVCGLKRRVRLEVSDQGAGVAPEERERIFAAYEQTEAGREAGGAGLGLAICAGNVALLGGRIGVDEAEGGGARFWFGFEAEAAEVQAAERTEVEPADASRALRVLAAEDNAANRQVLRVLLEPAGVDLIFAENGAEAVAAVQAEAFDLVLMDANMPVMDGATAVRAIRALGGGYAGLPIKMLTANAFDDDVAAYLAAGADAVLKKPIDLNALYEALNDAAAAAATGGGPERHAA